MAHNFKPVEESSIIKFNDQDFNSLRDQCLRKHQLFKDDTFPATASSIGQKLLQEKNLYRLEWKRPQVSEPWCFSAPWSTCHGAPTNRRRA